MGALSPAQVPAPYQDLYTQLTEEVADLQGSVSKTWDGSTYPVAFSAQLTDANSNNGPGLLNESSLTLIQSEIAQLKAVGVKAISVEVSFPMLYPPFFNSIGQPGYQAQFAAFYANVASAVHAQGLQLIVESQSLIPTGLQSVWGAGLQIFYAGFGSFQDYANARAQTVKTVAQTMHPDFFVLQEEPDTESNQSGQPEAGTVSGSTTMLNGSIAAARQANVPGMKIGAGFGSWLQAFQRFANSFTQQRCGQTVSGQVQSCISQPLDFLDMHLFPIPEQAMYCSAPPNPQPCTAPNFGQNALTILSTAQAARMPVTISQCWLRKVRDSEWLQTSGDIEEAREAYSFWEPLDSAFLQLVYSLANSSHMLFVVPFNSQSYYAYLNWSGGDSTCTLNSSPSCTALDGEGGGNTPAAIFAAVQSAGIANAASSAYSPTGSGYRSLITTMQPITIRLSTAGQIEPFAAGSIVTAYGANLAASAAGASAPSVPAGTTVTVIDSDSVSRPATVFYASPSQVNFEIPDAAAIGPAMVTIRSADGTTQSQTIQIASLSPGLFQLNTIGVAAAWILPVVSGVQQSLQPVYQLDASQNLVPLPLSLGPATEQIYLELYGTGLRNAKTVTATVGGASAPVIFAGAAPGFVGLDQVNVGPLPRSLAGQGSVNLFVTADGHDSNTVNLTFQ